MMSGMFFALIAGGWFAGTGAFAEEAIDAGSRKQLFIDDRFFAGNDRWPGSRWMTLPSPGPILRRAAARDLSFPSLFRHYSGTMYMGVGMLYPFQFEESGSVTAVTREGESVRERRMLLLK